MKTNLKRCNTRARWAALMGLVLTSTATVSAGALEYELIRLGQSEEMSTRPVAINGSNEVIGTYKTSEGRQRGFRWSPRCGFDDLGTLGGDYTHLIDINEEGHVLGHSETATGEIKTFLWTPESGMTALSLPVNNGSVGAAVGENGQAVGQYLHSNANDLHAFVWSVQSGLRRLGNLGDGPTTPMDVNGAGTVVGATHGLRGEIRAFRWTPTGGIKNLTSDSTLSHAVAVNERGDVIGRFRSDDGRYQAFLWTDHGGLKALGALGGPSSCPMALNETGNVVGWASTLDNVGHAFLFSEDIGMEAIDGLRDESSCAQDINEAGAVVGWTERDSGRRSAFLWERGTGLILLPAPVGVRSVAVAINNCGVVLGYLTADNGTTQACVWIPIGRTQLEVSGIAGQAD